MATVTVKTKKRRIVVPESEPLDLTATTPATDKPKKLGLKKKPKDKPEPTATVKKLGLKKKPQAEQSEKAEPKPATESKEKTEAKAKSKARPETKATDEPKPKKKKFRKKKPYKKPKKEISEKKQRKIEARQKIMEPLTKHWPTLFNDRKLPLAIGIDQVLIADLKAKDPEQDTDWVRPAIKEWCRQINYVFNVAKGGRRYGLEGKEGWIEEGHKTAAISFLRVRKIKAPEDVRCKRNRFKKADGQPEKRTGSHTESTDKGSSDTPTSEGTPVSPPEKVAL